jgi:hypothetical protein
VKTGIVDAGTLVKGIDEIFVSGHENDEAGIPLRVMDYRLRGNDIGQAYAGLEKRSSCQAQGRQVGVRLL